MIDIFTYLDYRAYLRDLYAEKKSKSKAFTYRYLAKETGLKSTGFFTWILQGKRNLSPHMVLKFSEVFKLTKKESAYFELLVRYNQAKSHEAKKQCFDKIASLKRGTAKLVNPEQYEFYEKWYYSAIRELLGIRPFQEDYNQLAKALIPHITPAEAKKAIDLLDKLGFIIRDDQNSWVRKDATLSTGDSWKSLSIAHYQMQAMELGKQAMDRFSKSDRDISTMTLSCSETTYGLIKEKLKEIRQELAELVKADQNPEGVFQCNFQLFPLTGTKNIAKPRAVRK